MVDAVEWFASPDDLCKLMVALKARIDAPATAPVGEILSKNPGLPDETGAFKEGVFVFRTLDDCHGILKRADTSRRAIVIGGGLLGLEAAKGLLNRGLEVHVLHLMAHVMDGQLDAAAGRILGRELEQMGIHVHLKNTVAAILGETHVTGVILKDGVVLDCDLVVVAAGIRPNVEIAVRAGLEVDRGIVEDELARRGRRMSTRSASAPSTAGAYGWWRRCGSRSACWRSVDRTKPRRVARLEHRRN
jgi:NADPH-dependent 2,4-dienoyl-CoA reductase/sulfur reductase-like enzyme